MGFLIKIVGKPKPTTVVQVSMPTSQAEDEDVEKVVNDIERVIQYDKGDENLIITGDWNAVAGEGIDVCGKI